MLRKRILDCVVGFLLCLIALPIVVVLAICVAITLRTWRPFFVQTRVGHRGRYFKIFKLRTLPRSTPRYATKDQMDAAPAEIPRLCEWLRSTHLDELPQLLMVLSGSLSLVGPRPRMPKRFEPVPEGYRALREQVPQGCTGLWQVSTHQDEMPDAHPEYDAFYVTHWSLRLDVWILVRTLRVLLNPERAIELEDVPRYVLGSGVEPCEIPLSDVEAAEAAQAADAPRGVSASSTPTVGTMAEPGAAEIMTAGTAH